MNSKKNIQLKELSQFFKGIELTDLKMMPNGLQLSNDISPIQISSINLKSNIIRQLLHVKYFYLAAYLSVFLAFLLSFLPLQILKTNNLTKQFLSFVFISIISIPLLINYQAYVNFEKRQLKTKPEFEWQKLFSYHREYGEYFSENYGFRNAIIRFHNNVKLKIFKISPIPERVVLGKNKWLFLGGKQVMDFNTNSCLYTIKELEQIKNNLELKSKWLKENGTEYYLFVPPIKSKVYNEFFPSNIRMVNKKSKIEQLIEYLYKYTDLHIIYPLEALKSAKKQLVYYPADTHWNFMGAFIGYQELFTEIKKDFPQITVMNIDEFDRVEGVHICDIGQLLGVDEYIYFDDETLIPKVPYKFQLAGNYTQIKDIDFLNSTMLTVHQDSSLPRAIFFRDSYSNYMIKYAGESFSRCLYLWTHKFKPEIIESEAPDIVVHEIVERFLDELLLEPNGINNEKL